MFQTLIGQSYRNLIETVHSPYTRLVYTNSLQVYMRFKNVVDCSQLLQGDPRLIQAQIIEYIISFIFEKKENWVQTQLTRLLPTENSLLPQPRHRRNCP
jgi:hypothetical protein